MRTSLIIVIMQRVVVISCRRFGTTYRSHLNGSVTSYRIFATTLEDGTDRETQNVRKKLPHHALYKHRSSQFSSTSQRKREFLLYKWTEHTFILTRGRTNG
jgi:hypothetical protein